MGLLSRGINSKFVISQIFEGSNCYKISSLKVSDEQIKQGSPGIKRSTFNYWWKLPPYTRGSLSYIHKDWTAASKFSPTSIALNITVDSFAI